MPHATSHYTTYRQSLYYVHSSRVAELRVAHSSARPGRLLLVICFLAHSVALEVTPGAEFLAMSAVVPQFLLPLMSFDSVAL